MQLLGKETEAVRGKQRPVFALGTSACCVCRYVLCLGMVSLHKTIPFLAAFTLCGSNRSVCVLKLNIQLCSSMIKVHAGLC